jgi:hypothetical protein
MIMKGYVCNRAITPFPTPKTFMKPACQGGCASTGHLTALASPNTPFLATAQHKRPAAGAAAREPGGITARSWSE